MTQVPAVSVVISTYNRSDLLPNAIQSVLGQDFQDFELIVIDDGSTDNTRQVVASFSDPRIRYVYQTNAGLAAGRNAGIRESRARYITFLDDDDVYLPHKLATQVSFMEAHPDIGWSSGGYLLADQDGKVLARWCPWSDYPSLQTTTWLFACPTGPGAVMVERSWFERTRGFDATNNAIDDWDMWLRLAYAGCKMAWVEDVLFEYRIHGANMVLNTQKWEAKRIVMLDRFYQRPDLPEEIMDLKSNAYAQAYLEASCRKYAVGLAREAQTDLAQAVSLEPAFLNNGGDYILQILCAEAQRPINRDAFAMMETALQNLPPDVSRLPRIRRRGRAKLAMSLFFRAAQQQDWQTMRRVLPKALTNDPIWVFNRGVWSLGASAIWGPDVVAPVRTFLHKAFRST